MSFSERILSKRSISPKISRLSCQIVSSCASSGTTKNVRQALSFFDLMMSPNMWSPTYKTSLPRDPISLEKTSQLPPEYT